MNFNSVLAAVIVLALAAPINAQSTSCYSSLYGGYSCNTPVTTYQVQPTAVPGQWAISGQDNNGRLYGCVAQENLSGDVVSTCR